LPEQGVTFGLGVDGANADHDVGGGFHPLANERAVSLVRCEPEANGASSGSSYHRGHIVDIGDDHGSTGAHAVFSQQVCDRFSCRRRSG
jgi:hypothetical protein